MVVTELEISLNPNSVSFSGVQMDKERPEAKREKRAPTIGSCEKL